MLSSLFIGSPGNKQKVMTLVDKGAECTLIHSNPQTSSGPFSAIGGYREHSGCKSLIRSVICRYLLSVGVLSFQLSLSILSIF